MILITLLTGCDGDFSQFLPTVKFNRFEVDALDFEHIDTHFVFDVDNPNPIGAPVDRFDYAFALEQVTLLSGSDPDGLELVADGTSELALPVSLDFVGVYEAITATRGLDYVGFGLDGSFGFDTDLGPINVIYDEDGSFPAPRIPRIRLGKLRVTDIGGSAVGFGLDMDVDNDHGSTINFRDLDFDLGFAGVHVGGGQLDELGDVEGATTETLTLPFSIDYADAIEAIGAAVSGEKIEVELDATMNVNTPFGDIPLHVAESGDIDVEQ
jgi:LEA14-like dessication related protein